MHSYPIAERAGDGTIRGRVLAWLIDSDPKAYHYRVIASDLKLNPSTVNGTLGYLAREYPEAVRRGPDAGTYRYDRPAPGSAVQPATPGKREYLLEVIHRENAPDGRVHQLLARDTDPGEGEPTLWVLRPFTLNGHH